MNKRQRQSGHIEYLNSGKENNVLFQHFIFGLNITENEIYDFVGKGGIAPVY